MIRRPSNKTLEMFLDSSQREWRLDYMSQVILDEPVCIIGAGASGLVTAHTLLKDGFKNVQVLTRDRSPGGVWAKQRIYPGLFTNNVHGEYNFSSLPMPPPANAKETGCRLDGEDMNAYMESYADKFLSKNIRYDTEVLKIRRDGDNPGWLVHIKNVKNGSQETLKFSRIVLCTGGASNPSIPPTLSASVANFTGFKGTVIHSSQFGPSVKQLVQSIQHQDSASPGSVVVVGGGKSAQDIAAYLAANHIKVSMVFETADGIFAGPFPLPDFIRKSRLMGILSAHIDLRTRLERFLHTTWLGNRIVHGFWDAMTSSSFKTLGIPSDSPLRRAHSLFWSIRTNDEGVERPDGFYSMVREGKINLVSPARAEKYSEDGHSVVLSDGQHLSADCVILATGYSSSWNNIFDEHTTRDLGLERHQPRLEQKDEWNYTTLSSPPPAHPSSQQWASSIYRGLVPAKNIARRDFTINGAVFTTVNGYTYEVSAHWISSYFLGDKMNIPSSAEEAFMQAERHGAWMRKRHPDMLLWANESYSSGVAFFT